MAKSDITLEQAQGTIDKVAKELGLIVGGTATFIKVEGPTNKHRIYVQKSRSLGRIDFTIDLPTDDPAYKQLGAPNGSIRCHIVPDLEQLERCLRMLGDSALGKQVPNKPRPFAATKQPIRKPKAIAAPIPEEALAPVPEGGVLKDRLAHLHARAREARINMLLENPETYGEMTRDDAAQHVDDRTDLRELADSYRAQLAAQTASELAEVGIEVS